MTVDLDDAEVELLQNAIAASIADLIVRADRHNVDLSTYEVYGCLLAMGRKFGLDL